MRIDSGLVHSFGCDNKSRLGRFMAIDTAIVRFLKQLAEGDGKPLRERTPDEARACSSNLSDLEDEPWH